MKKYFLYLFIILIIPATSFYFLDRSDFFKIEKIEVHFQKSNVHLAEEKISQTIDSFRGQSLWSLNLVNLENTLLKNPWVKNVSILKRWPSELLIQMELKDVHFFLKMKNGSLNPVVDGGDIISVKSFADLQMQAPVAQGNLFEKKNELRKNAIDLLKEIPNEGSFSKKMISEIHYSEKEGYWIQLIKNKMNQDQAFLDRSPGAISDQNFSKKEIIIKIGENQIALKSARIGQVLTYLDAHKMDVRVIDANLSKKVLVRLRKGP